MPETSAVSVCPTRAAFRRWWAAPVARLLGGPRIQRHPRPGALPHRVVGRDPVVARRPPPEVRRPANSSPGSPSPAPHSSSRPSSDPPGRRPDPRRRPPRAAASSKPDRPSRRALVRQGAAPRRAASGAAPPGPSCAFWLGMPVRTRCMKLPTTQLVARSARRRTSGSSSCTRYLFRSWAIASQVRVPDVLPRCTRSGPMVSRYHSCPASVANSIVVPRRALAIDLDR